MTVCCPLGQKCVWVTPFSSRDYNHSSSNWQCPLEWLVPLLCHLAPSWLLLAFRCKILYSSFIPVTVRKKKPHPQRCIDTNVSSCYFACLVVCISQQHSWRYVQISYTTSYLDRSINVGSTYIYSCRPVSQLSYLHQLLQHSQSLSVFWAFPFPNFIKIRP